MTETLTLPELMQVTPHGKSDLFIGQAESYGALGIYGGHFLGQALAAGLATVDEPKLANSFHTYFMKAGNPNTPIEYQVTRLRESRGSDTRSIAAIQEGETVFIMMAAFKMPEEGEEHQKSAPLVKTPDEIIQERQQRGEQSFPFPMAQHGRVEMEFISDSFREFIPDRDPYLQLWMRVPGCENIGERGWQVVLSYLSDATLMFNSVLPYGLPFQTHRLTSLDQSTWFHRSVDPGNWMVYDQRSIAAAGGRGLNEGEIYSQDGQLIASTKQESMLRKNP